ncbi:MAG: DNA replication and repair protein RecF [Saprospiraceae bacterium]
MYIKSLKLQNFNNYSEVDVDFHAEMNAITGFNGMGKTNMLDAIYYLCIGKSYFSRGDRYVIKNDLEKDQENEIMFRCFGAFYGVSGKEIVEVKVVPGKSKTISLSGKKRERLSDHIGKFPCVIIAPNDVYMMMDGSEERRKFIDNTIMQYDRSYVDAVLAYNRLLKQRNATLKMFAEKHYFDSILLESISANMYRPSKKIFEARKELIDDIAPLFIKYYGIISSDNESISINYNSHLEENSLKDIFIKNIEKDKILNRTTGGIHKDDIALKINGSNLKNFASQGQLKSVVLALKLAQYDVLSQKSKILPILLLDDIFDKLDRNRVEHLLSIVAAKEIGQVFISDTNNDRIPVLLKKMKISHTAFIVNNGKIIEQDVKA